MNKSEPSAENRKARKSAAPTGYLRLRGQRRRRPSWTAPP